MSRYLLFVALLAACPKKDAAPPSAFDRVELAVVEPIGYSPASETEPFIIVTSSGISVGDQKIAALVNGHVDPSEKEGGVAGVKIVRLTNFLAALVKAKSKSWLPHQPIQIAIDKSLQFGELYAVIFSAKQKDAGFIRFELLARANKRLVQVPVAVADHEPADAAPSGHQVQVGLVLHLSPTELLLASTSGLEGTIEHPKLLAKLSDPHAIDQLVQVLTEIAVRRWPNDVRPDQSMNIRLMADPATPMQRIAEVIGAIRETKDGKRALFPEITIRN